MAVRLDVTTSHRNGIIAHLNQYKTSQPNLSAEEISKYEHQLWLDYARLERPKRLCRMLLALIENAAKKEVSSYKTMQLVAGTDSYHEVMHLIKLLGELCQKNAWPAYPVLIKQESSGKVGAGFFTDYKCPDEQRDLFEAEQEIVCMREVPPTMFEICTRLLEFMNDKNLGKL